MGFVIGTAGHIDHGKTALVKALTGQDTDRLRAEKERGISIDLGFAHFTLPDQTEVSIVDVPGHERFIRNMVAGAHGIDLVLFVVAADDGVMPQTEEHFAITQTLGIPDALFVITKTDRVAAEQIEIVKDEVRLLTCDSIYGNSEIVPVSSTTGDGLDILLGYITGAVKRHNTKTSKRAFRMPVDRVFSVKGRGVVVTGTVLQGEVQIGTEIAIIPGQEMFRVRGLQQNGVDIETKSGKGRLAINLTGAAGTDIKRGDVACDAAIARTTSRLDVNLIAGPNIASPIRNHQRIRLHIGTAERLGKVTFLGQQKQLGAGQEALARLTLGDPIQAMLGDNFVIRNEQAENTLGGGKVLDPISEKTLRNDTITLGRLAMLKDGQILDAAAQLFCTARLPAADLSELGYRLNIPPADLAAKILADRCLIFLDPETRTHVTARARLECVAQDVEDVLQDHHKAQPSSDGLSAEELKTRILPSASVHEFRAFLDHLAAKGKLTKNGAMLSLPRHRAGLTDKQALIAEDFMATLGKAPYSPPLPDKKDRDLQLVIAHLEKNGRVRRTQSGWVFLTEAYDAALNMLARHFEKQETISAAEFRDLLGTSRKYALCLLENFDRSHHTVRVGDVRKSGRPRTAKAP